MVNYQQDNSNHWAGAGSKGYDYLLLFQRTWIWFQAPTFVCIRPPLPASVSTHMIYMTPWQTTHTRKMKKNKNT